MARSKKFDSPDRATQAKRPKLYVAMRDALGRFTKNPKRAVSVETYTEHKKQARDSKGRFIKVAREERGAERVRVYKQSEAQHLYKPSRLNKAAKSGLERWHNYTRVMTEQGIEVISYLPKPALAVQLNTPPTTVRFLYMFNGEFRSTLVNVANQKFIGIKDSEPLGNDWQEKLRAWLVDFISLIEESEKNKQEESDDPNFSFDFKPIGFMVWWKEI
jgi:hypothetical protein